MTAKEFIVKHLNRTYDPVEDNKVLTLMDMYADYKLAEIQNKIDYEVENQNDYLAKNIEAGNTKMILIPKHHHPRTGDIIHLVGVIEGVDDVLLKVLETQRAQDHYAIRFEVLDKLKFIK